MLTKAGPQRRRETAVILMVCTARFDKNEQLEQCWKPGRPKLTSRSEAEAQSGQAHPRSRGKGRLREPSASQHIQEHCRKRGPSTRKREADGKKRHLREPQQNGLCFSFMALNGIGIHVCLPWKTTKLLEDRDCIRSTLLASSISVQFSSVAQSCPTLCDPMNRSTPGLPVHHQLPEFTQTHIHRVHDAIQPSHPPSSPSPPALNPSQRQSLFQ